jgi:general secretion pathway protein K
MYGPEPVSFHLGRQRGVALLVVLWGVTLAAIILGALAASARVESLQARAQLDRSQSFYLAEAGLERAIFGLRLTDDSQRWMSDGRPYRLRVGEAQVVVSVTDDDGKINLNKANPALLGRLMEMAGADSGQTAEIVDAVTRWGSLAADAKGRPQFLAEGGFASIEELATMPGMSQDLYRRVEPALTLWPASSTPNLAHASALVVSASTGVSPEQAEAFVAARGELSAGTEQLPSLPNGAPSGFGSPASAIVSISSQATLADGVSTRLRVTVHLNDEPGDRRTYRVLRWQVDAGS